MNLTVPVIGILRGVAPDFFRRVMETSFASGLQAIEITMNTAGAAKIVSSGIAGLPAGKLLGMGTIRNLEEAKEAVGSGAMFLVTPNTDTDVIAYARSQSVPVIAGAFTPTEVYRAWSAGADMVKVFPASLFGPRYIRELRGPFDTIPLVAVGGVTRDNIGDYFAAGVQAVAASTALFGRRALMDSNLDQLSESVRTFVALCSHSDK